MVHWLAKWVYNLPSYASHGREACNVQREDFTPKSLTFHPSRFTAPLGQATKFAKQFLKRMNYAQIYFQTKV
jgi:hypothetical protein